MKTNYFSNILIVMLIILSGEAYCQNTYYGTGAGNIGIYNTCIGYYAGTDEEGSQNVYMGHFAGRYSYDTDRNIFIGYYTGSSNEEGFDNTFVGYRSGVLSETGGSNTLIGSSTGTYNTSGASNVFLGSHTGYTNATGNNNVYLGTRAGYSSTGSNNTFIGYRAGYSTTGSGNILIGYEAGFYETGSSKLYIANTTTSTPLIYGEFNNSLVGIYGKLGIGVKPTTNAMLRVFKSGAPYIELADTSNSLEIGLASATDSFATGAEPGDGVLRTMGGTQSMLLCIPNDENDGDSYIGFTDDYNGLWMKVCNDRQVRIDGTLHVKEVKIETDVWSDDVFDPGYQLSPLKEVEAYIKENRHLPEVPAAGEVIEKGIDVGEMNVILLKKVEELTLHLIEMEKRIRELEGEKK